MRKVRSSRRASAWLALGAVTAAGAALKPAKLYGQVPLPASQRPQPHPQLPALQFDIPAGPLDAVLGSYQSVTGIKVVLQIPDGTAAGFTSSGVAGVFTPAEALDKLLARTGLSGRLVDRRTAIVKVASRSDVVDVTSGVDTVELTKFSVPVVDIPQSISIVPKKVLAEQGNTSLRDTLRNVAGISLAAGEGGAQGDNLTLRGFTARNDIFMDGMRDFGSYYRDSFDVEQAEVLKGPSSAIFGRGSTGGVVNQVSKTPGLTRFITGTLQFGSDATRRVTADIDQPLNKTTAFRLNLMAHDAGVAGRDIAENRRFGVAPSLAFGLGTPTRVVLSYFHQGANDTPDYGIPWLFNTAAPVDRSNYYGFKDTNYLRTQADVGTIRAEHDFSPNITLRNQSRYAQFHRAGQITEARVAGNVTLDTPLDSMTVNRNQIAVNSIESFLDDQLDLTIRFRTGGLRHSLVTGIEGSKETSNPTRFTWLNVPGTSLLHPDEDQPFSGSAYANSRVHTTAISVGAYAIDTVELGEHWDVTGGIRWDRFDTGYHQLAYTQQGAVTPTDLNRLDEKPSWRGAIVYKPAANGSVYFSYGTSFNPSAESLSLSASTSNTEPEKNRTFEVGTKWDLPNRTSLRAAFFHTDKTNAREPSVDDPTVNVVSGSQRVQGIEVEVSGHITRRWEVFSGYAFMDSALVKSLAYPDAVGAQLANVPRHTFNHWSTFDMPWRFKLGGGAQYVGSRTASSTAPNDPVTGLVKQLPGYWTFNLMGKRRITEHVELQVNAYNITDKYYFDQLHPGHIVPGPGRSVSASTNFKF